MPTAYYIVPVPDSGRPDQGLPTPPLIPGYPLPGVPAYPDQGLPPGPVHPWWGGRFPPRPDQGLPWPPAYPGHGLPPLPVRPDNSLPGSGIPWWLLPFLIGPAGGVYAGVTESGIPIHPEKPDPTKPGTWILVGVGPGDVRWAWAPTPEAAEPK